MQILNKNKSLKHKVRLYSSDNTAHMWGKLAFDIQIIGNLQRLKHAYVVGQFVEEEQVLKKGKLKI